MRVVKILGIAVCYVSTMLGAGMMSGKEIAVFFNNANFLSILFCAILIGLGATLFLFVAKISNCNTLEFIFGKYKEYGSLIVRLINLLFLSAMLSASETLTLQLFNLKGGGIIMSIIVLLVFNGGSKYLRVVAYLLTPISVILLIALFYLKGHNINGELKILLPLTYASMNMLGCGLFSEHYAKDLKKGEPFLIGTIVGFVILGVFCLIKGCITNFETTNIPIYSVSLDTILQPFLSFIIIGAIITSAVCNLSLSLSKKDTFSPLITLLIALIISSLGFNQLVKYCYPFIGVVYLGMIVVLICKVISLKLKVKFRGLHL